MSAAGKFQAGADADVELKAPAVLMQWSDLRPACHGVRQLNGVYNDLTNGFARQRPPVDLLPPSFETAPRPKEPCR